MLLELMYDVTVSRNVSTCKGVRIMSMANSFPRIIKRKKNR
jgi:hypothetical protein